MVYHGGQCLIMIDIMVYHVSSWSTMLHHVFVFLIMFYLLSPYASLCRPSKHRFPQRQDQFELQPAFPTSVVDLSRHRRELMRIWMVIDVDLGKTM